MGVGSATGETRAMRAFRGQLNHYARHVDGLAGVRDRLVRVDTLDELTRLLEGVAGDEVVHAVPPLERAA